MTEQISEILRFRPSWQYYVIHIGWIAIIAVVMLFVGGMDGISYGKPWYIVSAILGLIALYKFIEIRKLCFTLTKEQLIIQQGIILRTCDYLELYRIIDFAEHQNLTEQIWGLKTVILFSTDRTHPKIFIPGIIRDNDIVKVIRDRVIYNRTIRNIHEFSNLI